MDAGRPSPHSSSAGPIDLAFGETDDAGVDQLRAAVGLVINSLVGRMEALLSRFGVRAADRSPCLRRFDSASDLLEVYLNFVPQDLGGTAADEDSIGGDNEESEDESGEPGADESELKDSSLGCLAEAISMAVGDDSMATGTGGGDAGTAATSSVVGGPSEVETETEFCEDDDDLAEAPRKFSK